MNLARKAGYEGEDKKNVTKAIDALADTLAGEDLEQATNVAAAIRKLEPYVGGGGGGEVASYTLENYNKIQIKINPNTTLQENEVDAWVDEQVENWINGEVRDDSIEFIDSRNLIANNFMALLDKSRNIINALVEPETTAVGGGILFSKTNSVFVATTLEKEGMVISGAPHMFHLSPQQDGCHHLLYAIRTEYDDNDLLAPLEVIDKFDAEGLIEDTVTVTVPWGGSLSVPLVNYPSLNSLLSLDDFIAAELNPSNLVEPRIVLCEIYIKFDIEQTQ